MFLLLSNFQKFAGRIVAALSILWLAACQPVSLSDSGPSINTKAAVPVALLVPGGSANPSDNLNAKNLENAARLAIADLQGVKIDLRVYNTAGNPSQAATVAVQAVNEGAKIIVGPLYAKSANAVGNAVASRNVNVLAFSNNAQIAGGNVFILGPTFENTANRLVAYAKRQGRSKIAIVHARTQAGEIGRAAISNAISRAGATPAGVASYEFSQDGIINAVPQIAQTIKSGGAQAVFFTASTDAALPLLTQMLPENGVNNNVIKYIGLTRWDIPPATLALPGVQGAWFAMPHPGMTAKFRERYSAAFGSNPLPIAGLSYDGIAAIGALVKAGKSNALTTSALTQGAGFVGANGIFRLRNDGTNERGLAVAQIQNNQVVIVDAAPSSFGGAGF
ncbi:penicillin-binding protein activator [Profundibacter amoris]|uniref:Penicillin-binding protein activator n=1 Tax=Profundibacter amoris TaxID=2171755 RepID=A0A347UJU5_9RHOB|nr:penicillin-binding protein activator [Profundibacter amoris]AXX99123.1 penicillin-binding protein activator [Profundibacter amoris]